METPDKNKLLEEWAEICLQQFIKAIEKRHIGVTGNLAASFKKHVDASANGDIDKINFMYLLYGMYEDMGVGKGTNLSGVKSNSASRRLEGKHGGNRRIAKKWYSKTIYSQLIRLAELTQQYYGNMIIGRIIEETPEKLEVKL